MSNDPFDCIKRNRKEYNSTTVFNLKEIVTNEVKETRSPTSEKEKDNRIEMRQTRDKGDWREEGWQWYSWCI